MRTVIDSAVTARAHRGPFAAGGLHLADAAARACLRRAHREARDLDLLINAGLYKDKNLAEPALAAIIQEDIGANPGHPPRDDRHGTFSFDVLNGGCGVLTAAHLLDAFVRPGTARLGLVVAADVDPSPHTSRGFPFAPVGGALLCSHSDGDDGFRRFQFRTFPDHAGLFEVRVCFDAGAGRHGNSVLQVHEDAAFGPRCLACATQVTHEFLAQAELGVGGVDLLLASQYPLCFADELAAAIGLPPDRVPRVPAALAAAHTAGPIVALEAAMESGAFARAQNVLFVTAGAGITIAAALYQRTPGRPA